MDKNSGRSLPEEKSFVLRSDVEKSVGNAWDLVWILQFYIRSRTEKLQVVILLVVVVELVQAVMQIQYNVTQCNFEHLIFLTKLNFTKLRNFWLHIRKKISTSKGRYFFCNVHTV